MKLPATRCTGVEITGLDGFFKRLDHQMDLLMTLHSGNGMYRGKICEKRMVRVEATAFFLTWKLPEVPD